MDGDGAAGGPEAPRRAGDSGGRAREPGRACAGRREGRAGAEGEGRGNYHWAGLGCPVAAPIELELKKTGELVPERISGEADAEEIRPVCL
jgi:hypothetical protein